MTEGRPGLSVAKFDPERGRESSVEVATTCTDATAHVVHVLDLADGDHSLRHDHAAEIEEGPATPVDRPHPGPQRPLRLRAAANSTVVVGTTPRVGSARRCCLTPLFQA